MFELVVLRRGGGV